MSIPCSKRGYLLADRELVAVPATPLNAHAVSTRVVRNRLSPASGGDRWRNAGGWRGPAPPVSTRTRRIALSRGTIYPVDVLAERPVYVRLVSATVTSMTFEPRDDVRVEPDRNLLLHRPVENPAPRVRPVEYLWSIRRVDLVVVESLQRPHLLLNIGWQLSHIPLHKPSSCLVALRAEIMRPTSSPVAVSMSGQVWTTIIT